MARLHERRQGWRKRSQLPNAEPPIACGHRTRVPARTADREVSKKRAPCSPRLWRSDGVPYVSIGSNFGFLALRDAFLCSVICRRRGAQKISRPTPSESCSRRASIAHLKVGGGKSWYGFARPQSWGCALVGTGSRRQYPGPVTPRTPDRGRGGRRPLDGTIIVVPYRSRATPGCFTVNEEYIQSRRGVFLSLLYRTSLPGGTPPRRTAIRKIALAVQNADDNTSRWSPCKHSAPPTP